MLAAFFVLAVIIAHQMGAAGEPLNVERQKFEDQVNLVDYRLRTAPLKRIWSSQKNMAVKSGGYQS